MEDGLKGRAFYRDRLAPALRLLHGSVAAIRLLAPRIQKDGTCVRGSCTLAPWLQSTRIGVEHGARTHALSTVVFTVPT